MVAILPAGAAMSAGYSSAAVLGEDITGSAWLGGMAAASMTTGAALSAVPLARLMAARGRRPGLVVGYLIACAGSVLAAVAALLGWYPLLILGILGIGTGNASNLAARYAAADLADDDGRAKAIGSLVWASTFGTVLGPAIGLGPAPRAADLIGLPPLVGPYLLCIVLFSGAALFIWQRLVPDPLVFAGGVGLPTEVRQSLRTSVRMLAGSSSGRLAVLGMVAGHVVMVGVMTMTPLHMRDGNQDLQIVGFVISLHVIGMYAFSPVVGWFADRDLRRALPDRTGVELWNHRRIGAAHRELPARVKGPGPGPRRPGDDRIGGGRRTFLRLRCDLGGIPVSGPLERSVGTCPDCRRPPPRPGAVAGRTPWSGAPLVGPGRRPGFSTGLEGEVDEGSDAVRAQQVDAEDRHQDDRRLDHDRRPAE